MTSYQSRLQDEGRMKCLFRGLTMTLLVVSLMVATIANYGLRRQMETKSVGLLTCQEFLSDLEASEIFEE